MKTLFHILIANLLLIQIVIAQTNASTQSSVPTQSKTKKLTPEQSAQLGEASQLSASVVKLYNERKYDEALPLAKRAVEIREQVLGHEHQLVADAIINLAAVYQVKGNVDKSEASYESALKIYEKTLAPDDLKFTRLLESLALLERFSRNDYNRAIIYYQRSLAIKEKKIGASQEVLIPILKALAELYELSNKNKDAVQVHQRIISIYEQTSVNDLSKLIQPLQRYACVTERLKLKDETKKAEDRIQEIETSFEMKRLQSDDKVIKTGVLNGIAISKPAPPYPEAAKQQHVSGTVKVWITVDETGRVIDAAPCGHPLLTDAAVRAAYAARFTPTLLSGQPVKVVGVITYNFTLQ